jgi:hypothetical protein
MCSAPAKGPYSRTISAMRTGACRFVSFVLLPVLLIGRSVSRAWEMAPLGQIYASDSAAGSNKIVVNPPRGGDSQRCARARPIARTRPRPSSSTSARCTVRWLAPRASARAEVDQAAPSASSASSDA